MKRCPTHKNSSRLHEISKGRDKCEIAGDLGRCNLPKTVVQSSFRSKVYFLELSAAIGIVMRRSGGRVLQLAAYTVLVAYFGV